MSENEAPKKGGILRGYLNFNVLYKILIGLVIGAIAGIILAACGVTSLPAWISMFGTIFTRLLKMIIIPMIVGSLVVGASSVSPANVGKVGIRIIIIYLATSAMRNWPPSLRWPPMQPAKRRTSVCGRPFRTSSPPASSPLS